MCRYGRFLLSSLSHHSHCHTTDVATLFCCLLLLFCHKHLDSSDPHIPRCIFIKGKKKKQIEMFISCDGTGSLLRQQNRPIEATVPVNIPLHCWCWRYETVHLRPSHTIVCITNYTVGVPELNFIHFNLSVGDCLEVAALAIGPEHVFAIHRSI